MLPYALEELVLGRILEEKATRHGREVFLKFRAGDLTFKEVNEAVDRMSRGLMREGVRPGDHVALMLPNCPEFVLTILALAKLGAVAVPVNTTYRGDLLVHVLATSEASALIVDERFLDPFGEISAQLPELTTLAVRTRGSALPLLGATGKRGIFLRDLLARGGEPPRIPVRHCDLLAIMYTSGSTGPSKGVMVPHAHALTDAQDSAWFGAYTPGETIYCPLPLFHAAALWDGVFTALLLGGAVAIVERFSASRFWTDVRHFGANVAMGVFSMISILLKQPPTPQDHDHPLRSFYLGKSAFDTAFRDRFGVRCVETYTSTEVGIATGSPYGQWRSGSCGKSNDFTHEVKVVDELDEELGPGESGELVVRPKRPFVMTPGYYRYAEATTKSFRNLWFHTGDRAYRDEDGYFYFVDRMKDCIRRRGENISAFEVEQTINTHPSVLECAAFGVPSEMEEEEVMAAVVLRKGQELKPEALAAHCRTRLPAFMVPRYVEFVDALPKTPVGKIAKHELRSRGDHGITTKTWDGVQAGLSASESGR